MKTLKEIKAKNKILNNILLNIINKLEDLKKLIQFFLFCFYFDLIGKK
jgi:hypothetical protein